MVQPMSPNEVDRALILRRRAAFVASALATLGGCGGAKSGASTEARSPVVAVPEPSPDAGGSEEPPPDRESQVPAASGMPSLEIPDGLNQQAHENFARLVGQARRANDLLDRLDGTLRTACDVLDPACDARLKLLAEGKEINYEGASGPCDFTDIGDIFDCKFRYVKVEGGKFKFLKVT